MSSERGQVAVLVVGGLVAVLVGAFVLGAVAKGMGRQSATQRAADLGALAGARAMRAAYPRLFEPAIVRRRANPRHLEKAAYLELGRNAAVRVASENGAPGAQVAFPDAGTFAPVRVRVDAARRFSVGRRRLTLRAVAEAELAPPGGLGSLAAGGGYDGPFRSSQTRQQHAKR